MSHIACWPSTFTAPVVPKQGHAHCCQQSHKGGKADFVVTGFIHGGSEGGSASGNWGPQAHGSGVRALPAQGWHLHPPVPLLPSRSCTLSLWVRPSSGLQGCSARRTWCLGRREAEGTALHFPFLGRACLHSQHQPGTRHMNTAFSSV